MSLRAAPVDPAFAKLLADPRVTLRAPAPAALDDLRAAANAFMARANGPNSIAATELTIPGRHGEIAARIYGRVPGETKPVIVFVHGGGFVMGSLDSHDGMCRSLALHSGAVVVAADYALAPEHPFPRPLHDIVDTLQWVRRAAATLGVDPQAIALAGDSAGAQLAVAAALQEQSAQRPIGHVGLLYPMIDPAQDSSSAKLYREGYMLTGDFVAYGWAAYAGNDPAASIDPCFDLRRADWRGFPPTTIVLAECDPLHDDGQALAERMRAAGVDVTTRVFGGMIHAFAGLPHLTQEAEVALQYLGARLVSGLRAKTAT